MSIYVVSDLHLDESAEAQLFDDARQGARLAALCERVAQDRLGELVLLGDTFDFTAMTPPLHGLEHFAQAVGMPYAPAPRRDVVGLCEAVRESNPTAVEALAWLSTRAPVTFVPGNHDWQLGSAGATDGLSTIGLSNARVAPRLLRTLGGRRLLLQHGHELDPGNATPEAGGEALTAVMHHAVVPFLRYHGARRNVRMDADRVVALRPEESVVSVLERWLEPDVFKKFFRAFLRILAENGYVPRVASWLAAFVSTDRVRARIQSQDRLWEQTAVDALHAMEGRKALPGSDAPRPDLVVMGHTHVLDWAVQDSERPGDQLYVNLGTWTERASDANGPRDRSLPVLLLQEEGGDASALLSNLEDGTELQRFEAGGSLARRDDAPAQGADDAGHGSH